MTTISSSSPGTNVYLHRLKPEVTADEAKKAIQKNGSTEVLFSGEDGRLYALQGADPAVAKGQKVGDSIELGALKGRVIGIDVERDVSGLAVAGVVGGIILFGTGVFAVLPAAALAGASGSAGGVMVVAGLASLFKGADVLARHDNDPLPRLMEQSVKLDDVANAAADPFAPRS